MTILLGGTVGKGSGLAYAPTHQMEGGLGLGA